MLQSVQKITEANSAGMPEESPLAAFSPAEGRIRPGLFLSLTGSGSGCPFLFWQEDGVEEEFVR